MTPEQIERQSMDTIRREMGSLADRFDERELPVVMRVIHATADFSFADTLSFSSGAVDAALDALRAGATIVTDTNMALAGVSKPACRELGCTPVCFMADPDVARRAKQTGVTRAVASMDAASEIQGRLIVAIGNAPTALLRVVELVREGRMHPDLVIGVPVGFVNVVEAKQRLLESGIPSIVARGRRGGSTVATAIVNALLYQLSRPGWNEASFQAETPDGSAMGASGASDSSVASGVPGKAGFRDDVPADLAGIPSDATIAVFAGTTEGRRVCERLVAAKRRVRAFVATEYGAKTLGESPYLEIRTGRLEARQMEQALQGCAAAVDATHPYAHAASDNIRHACAQAGIPCVRLLRPPTPLPSDAIVASDAAEAARVLSGQEGNVLVATGAKELSELAKGMGSAERIYARVLPTREAIETCANLGIPSTHVVCVQGPVSHEFNCAMLRDAQARWMLTKDSGLEGGMPQKVSAAQECGARLVVIARPEEPGQSWSLDQVCRALRV